MTKPTVLFFARGYQTDFYPKLVCEDYDAVFVTLTRAEKQQVERNGCRVEACFEEDFERIVPVEVDGDYLITSLAADRFLGRFDHVERLRILGREIAFWRALIERFQPVAVVNELVAIEIAEVLLIESRRAGIRYLAGMHAVVDDRFYWLPDPISISGRHLELNEASEADHAAAHEYVHNLIEKNHRPWYVIGLAGRHAVLPFVVALVKYAVWSLRARQRRFRYESYVEDYRKRVTVYLRGWFFRYDRLDAIPDDREIVFYPLHQEPEATLDYMSDVYASQAATIENILKCLTPRQVLVVKEHPVDKGSLLQKKFWRLRKSLSGLYLLPGEVDGRQVFSRATRIVTLTSTVGWEAAANGKAVYVLGQIFFDALPGVQVVSDFRMLREMLHRPVPQPVRREDIERMVAQMLHHCHPGNPFPHAGLYTPENIRRVIDAILDGARIGAASRSEPIADAEVASAA